jgi:N6-adenosine-specific RNA methylase IME4
VTELAQVRPAQLRSGELLEGAYRALAEVETLPDLATIVDRAEVIRVAARKAKAGRRIQNDWAEFKLRAQRRGGELVDEVDRHRPEEGRPKALHDVTHTRPTLVELGLGETAEAARLRAFRWREIARVPGEAFESYIERITTGNDDGEDEITTAGLIASVQSWGNRPGTTADDVQAPEAPPGTFATLVADPPWQYENRATRGAAEDHYRTLSVAELCELGVPHDKAAPAAHLYLWTTAGFLREAFEVMEAWGFTYKTYLAWVKPQMGMGNYFRVSSELVLFGTKGGLATQPAARSLMNWFEARRGKHSAKPDAFPELVQKASPGPYLELFARCRADRQLICYCSRCRFGWGVWGLET